MSDRETPPEQDLDKLLAEAAPYADFLRDWNEHAQDIDEFLESDGNPIWSQPGPPKSRKPATVPAWWSALAASTGGSMAGGMVSEADSEDSANQTGDWWVLRPASDGGVLYVGNPERVKDGAGWGAVTVTLPDRQLSGTALYASVDLAVVQLNPPDAA